MAIPFRGYKPTQTGCATRGSITADHKPIKRCRICRSANRSVSPLAAWFKTTIPAGFRTENVRQRAQQTRTVRERSPSMKVMLVEDDELVCVTLVDSLEDAGIQVAEL